MNGLFYKAPDICVEDMWQEQMLCDSLMGGLEDTIDDPISF